MGYNRHSERRRTLGVIKVNSNERMSHAPISLVVDGKLLRVVKASSRFEMTRKWRGMSKVRFIVYRVRLENDAEFEAKLHLSNMKWEVERVS